MADRRCSIEGCDAVHLARGWCTAHYKRWKRHGNPLLGGTPLGAPRAWIHDVLLVETDACVEWPYGRKDGYGFLNDGNGGTITASRLVCIESRGHPPIPQMEAAHSCGNRGCCNKRHIRWATYVENNADKRRHGTHLEGEACPNSIFTTPDVIAMRHAYASGETYTSIAKRFDADVSHIRHIVIGDIWKGAPGL